MGCVARASGNSFAFSPGGELTGANVTAIDADGVPPPGATTVTGNGVVWALDALPRGKELSVLPEKQGFATTQRGFLSSTATSSG